jgi:hypothetical protein
MWIARTSSPFRWKVTLPPVNVTMGSAAGGDGGVVVCENSVNCSELMRLRTFSCATMIAPVLPRFSLPPVWSPCQWVLSTKRTGLSVSLAIASTILGVSGAYWSSTRKTASGPMESPMLPPAPASM